MQAEPSEQAHTGHGVIAGDDADLRMVSYPIDAQEPQDLCIDVTVRQLLSRFGSSQA